MNTQMKNKDEFPDTIAEGEYADEPELKVERKSPTPRKTCYVCGNKGSSDKMVYLPGGLWRHSSKCYPGSKAWMDSEVGKASPRRKYFIELNDLKEGKV